MNDRSNSYKIMGTALVIPTRNRPNELLRLIHSIEMNTKIPEVIVVVDSSDLNLEIHPRESSIEFVYEKTSIQSAAQQRNIGIEIILNRFSIFKWVSFLDDDLIVPRDYFLKIDQLLSENDNIVGVSGVTIPEGKQMMRNSLVGRWIGMGGKPGSISPAVVNIPPESDRTNFEAEWLIGCSTWRVSVFESLRFEKDFMRQSLFEDVIFSKRAKSFGNLLVSSDLKIHHDQSPIGRANSFIHYKDWVINRYRMFRYYGSEFSIFRFWFTNMTLAFLFFLKALIRISGRDFLKSLGILAGTFHLVVRRHM